MEHRQLFAPFLTGSTVGEGNHEAYCPSHEDPATSRKPSAQINFKRKIWFCFVCIPEHAEARLSHLAKVLEERVNNGEIDLEDVRDESGDPDKPVKSAKGSKRPEVDEGMIGNWRTTLLDLPDRLSWLREQRGLTDETIEAWQIGYSNLLHRYTIPLYSADGAILDARCRTSKADADTDKYIWWRGGSNPPLFGVHMCADKPYVVVFEGEFDTILAWQLGIPAVSGTAGSNTWKARWTPWFAGKQVYFCYDDDKAGRQGRVRATKSVKQVAESVHWIDLFGGKKAA